MRAWSFMKTILIFDYGFSGYLLSNEIEDMLMVEVKRITAGSDKDLLDKSNYEIIEEMEKELGRYIGLVDVIVIANPIVSMIAKESLESIYPEQLFVGYGWDMPELLKDTKKALVLAPSRMARIGAYQRIKAECDQTDIIESDSNLWLDIIKEDIDIEDTVLMPEIEKAVGGKIIIYNSGLLMMRRRLTEKVGWKVEVVDFFNPMIEKLCRVLNLKTETEIKRHL